MKSHFPSQDTLQLYSIIVYHYILYLKAVISWQLLEKKPPKFINSDHPYKLEKQKIKTWLNLPFNADDAAFIKWFATSAKQNQNTDWVTKYVYSQILLGGNLRDLPEMSA